MQKIFVFIPCILLCQFVSGQKEQKNFLSQADHTIRIVSYNVNKESLFLKSDSIAKWPERPEKFARIIQALQPQIICLQEIWPERPASEILNYFNSILPQKDNTEWKLVRAGDNVILSIYPLKQLPSKLAEQERQANALVDLPNDVYKKDLCIIAAHFKSGGGDNNIQRRMGQSDNILNWIRDAKTAGGDVDLSIGTPIVIAGDFNAYPSDSAIHPISLLTGNISNEMKFGADIYPDWDNSSLTDLHPKHNSSGNDEYTYRYDNSAFPPAALDRIVYTDFVLAVVNSFILNTMTMSKRSLKKNHLGKTDAILFPEKGAYDHLPLVADFSLKN